MSDQKVAERTRVDTCFGTAEDHANRVVSSAEAKAGSITDEGQRAFALTLVTALEQHTHAVINALQGVARQVRDMDDQQYASSEQTREAVAGAISAAAENTTAAINDVGSGVLAVSDAARSGKDSRGLFGSGR